MAMEIGNFLHAAATVFAVGLPLPIFLGQGNSGFAPWGTDPTKNCVRFGPGRYRMRMLAPIDFAGGGGIVVPVPFQAGFFPPAPGPNSAFITADVADNAGFFVQTQLAGADADTGFSILVVRFAQIATGV